MNWSNIVDAGLSTDIKTYQEIWQQHLQLKVTVYTVDKIVVSFDCLFLWFWKWELIVSSRREAKPFWHGFLS